LSSSFFTPFLLAIFVLASSLSFLPFRAIIFFDPAKQLAKHEAEGNKKAKGMTIQVGKKRPCWLAPCFVL
jgi:hypothetical protein